MRHIDLTNDLDVLFGTIDGEAENQPYLGQVGVGCSIMTRAKLASALHKPQFGDGTVRGACLAPKQYDCWFPGPDRDRIMAIDLDNLTPIQHQIMGIAQQILSGAIQDPTEEATHYFARSIPAPAWVAGAKFCVLLGAHLFWNNVR